MELADLMRVRDASWRSGAASLQARHVADVLDLVSRHRPRRFVEIGTATGLTTALVAHMLEHHGGERVVTVDFSARFYGDPSLETGFVIPEAYPSGPVQVERHVEKTSLDVIALGETFDMGLVDGNHFHPWPLIDTLCLYPVLTGPRRLIHDDLNLFLAGGGRRIGPKYVFDQFPDSHRTRLGERGNMFVLDLTLGTAAFEEHVREALHMPWTGRRPTPEQLDALRGIVADHYSPQLLEQLDSAVARFGAA